MSNIIGRISAPIRSAIQRVNTQGLRGLFGGTKSVHNSMSMPETTSAKPSQNFSLRDFSRTVLNGLAGYKAKPAQPDISTPNSFSHASVDGAEKHKENKAFAKNMVRLIHDKESAAAQLSILRDHQASGLEKAELKSLHKALKLEVKRAVFNDIKLLLLIRKEIRAAKAQGDQQKVSQLRSKMKEVAADGKALLSFSKSITGARQPDKAFVKNMVGLIHNRDSANNQLTLLKDYEASMVLNKAESKNLHKALKKEARKGMMNDIRLMLTIRKEIKTAKAQGDHQTQFDLRSKMKEAFVDMRALAVFSKAL